MLLTIIAFLVILSVLVIVHEIGHFATAKYFGVQVEEFGIGFPPRAKLVHTSNDGVKWTVNLLPLGGFVKLKGEDGSSRESPDSFAHKAPWKRVTILAAGVAMNFILAFILFSAGYAIGFPRDLTGNEVPQKFIKEKYVAIIYIKPDGPAARAGILEGDSILKINNAPLSELSELQNFIGDKEGKPALIEFRRGKEIFTKTIAPELVTFEDIENEGQPIQKVGIGVGLSAVGVVRYPIHLAIVKGAETVFTTSGKIVTGFFHLIRDLVVSRQVNQNIGGPVMIAALSGRAAELGFIYILQFVALLSLNLAIINIFPLPALDGGRVLFVIIEKLKGKAVSMYVESWIHLIGFWLLIFLMVIVTARDIIRFEIFEKVKGIFTS
ncbi:MAG: RIP metalloprotease RseP [Candidatus Jacksonbacteria bacterium]|nr:RIP metalloprotease RseP [Candidatus Jacksonbacteria bacterium]